MYNDRDYFILNGINCLYEGIETIELPPLTKPRKRIEEVPVLGMDGALTITDNTYEPMTKICRVFYDGDNCDRLADFLADTGQVIFSNNPNRYYNYKIMNEINFSDVIDTNWREFDIYFRCQPFSYDLINETIVITKKNTIINNSCTHFSLPIITVYGTGNINLFVGEQQITLNNVVDKITINSVKQRVYKDNIRENDKKIGKYQFLDIGENNITWDGLVTKIEIIPNWRYLI